MTETKNGFVPQEVQKKHIGLGKRLTHIATGAAYALGLGAGGHAETTAASTPIINPAIIAELPQTVTPLGMPLRKDAINLVFSGTQQQVDAALHVIGYKNADKFSIANKARAIAAACAKSAPGNQYATAPNPEELLRLHHPDGSFFQPDSGPSQQTIAPRRDVLDWSTKFGNIEVGVADNILKVGCGTPFQQDTNIKREQTIILNKFKQAGYPTMVEGNNLGNHSETITLASGAKTQIDGTLGVVDVAHRNK